MNRQNANVLPTKDNIELAEECLRLIAKIAGRGAGSDDPGQIGYALQELTQVMVERTGTEERVFEPVPAGEIGGLQKLYEELDFVNDSAQRLDTPGWAQSCDDRQN